MYKPATLTCLHFMFGMFAYVSGWQSCHPQRS